MCCFKGSCSQLAGHSSGASKGKSSQDSRLIKQFDHTVLTRDEVDQLQLLPFSKMVGNCGLLMSVIHMLFLLKVEMLYSCVNHEPNTECGSIENRGGFVSNVPGDVPRVNGQLAVSCAFGDKSQKSHLRSDPDIHYEDVTVNNDLLIFASDGLWKVMSNAEADDIARKRKDTQAAAWLLTMEAVNRVSKA